MKQRCTDPDRPGYLRYGGRGITICDQWLNSFESFLADMGPKPNDAKHYHIHRLDNDGDYEPGNCIWIEASEHSRLTRQLDKAA
jgi:hypothetical protein